MCRRLPWHPRWRDHVNLKTERQAACRASATDWGRAVVRERRLLRADGTSTAQRTPMRPLAAPAGRAMPANFFFRDLGLIRPQSVLSAVMAGFESARKSLPPWLLYDARGAQLFQAITRTQDYYVTRVEAAILASRRHDLAGLIDAQTVILEYGPGEMRKVRLLLAAGVPARYLAVDISGEQLLLQGI